ncbi:serine/threonine protein kinase [Nonomuraea typhae]|uniref:Serine/threonine protein kinase n=1 Tax=Nonomuraea typhae TaxID=2603600 RepID=A0ABW7Z4Y0_9ACTN
MDDFSRIGPYTVLSKLGEGGQGVVYLAEAGNGGPVAVKVLHADFEPGARERFAREFQVLQRVSGFCTARLLDADVASTPPYLVSEYVPGPSLHAYVRAHGPRGAAELERLAVATLTALTAIHRAGIVHRDFKPQNVLMGPDGPRVIDFGIARVLEAEAVTVSEQIGTPTYMAPEQIRGGRFNAAADVFAWGATMVYAATGSSPFAAESVAAVIYRVLTAEPDLRGLPEALRPLVAACLAKDPGRRPTAQALLDQVTALGPMTPIGRLRKRRWPVLAAAGAALILVGGGIAGWLALPRPGEARTPPDYATQATAAAKAAFEARHTFDYASIDADIERARNLMTGTAARDYENLSKSARELIIQYQARQTLQTTDVGLISVAPERVRLVLMGEVTLTQQGKQAQGENPMLFVEMVPHGGDWKMEYGRPQPSGGKPPFQNQVWPPPEIQAITTHIGGCHVETNVSGPYLDNRPEFFDRCLTGKAKNWWRGLAEAPESQIPPSWTGKYQEIITAVAAFPAPDEVRLVHIGASGEGKDRKVVGSQLYARLVDGTWRLEDVVGTLTGRSLFQRNND